MSGAPLNYVGVFQNHPIALVAEIANQLQLHAVQLHGNEDADYIAQLRQQLNESVEIWKAYGVTKQAPTLLTQDVDRHLFDAQIGQQSGGTGTTFDWTLLDDPSHIMLAGGLNPDNAQKAASLGCLGLDLNSGVEESPGKKDLTKLQQAFAAIRNY
ncbi:bifunctional indole-3-glycerol phosphate synthase/phosphoribosylanthranilate isomerase, partial [Vibrio vulnificus]